MSAASPATPRRGVPLHLTQIPSLSRASFDTTREAARAHMDDRSDTGSSGSNVLVERRCLLWVHDDHFSKEDVIINLDLFPPHSVRPGELMAILPLKAGAGFRDVQEKRTPPSEMSDSPLASSPITPGHSDARPAGVGSAESQHDNAMGKRYLFAAREMSKEMKSRFPSLEISVAKHVADAFGFKSRSTVLVMLVSDFVHISTLGTDAMETNAAITTASHVELAFKDIYLSRSDMWRLATSELSNKTVYKGQKIVFMGTIKATVTSVYVSGKKVPSAFFSTNTRPIFRSEAARFVLFVQMSREMWDFDSEGSGEIMFTKVVNGFLPALFRKWATQKSHHLVTIVLFTRVEYDTGLTTDLGPNSLDTTFHTGIQGVGTRKPYKDFYRVVVSEMASGEWTTILYQLKREFRFFRHDISMYRLNSMAKLVYPEDTEKGMGSAPGTRIEAEPSLAIHGNILEAISLATSQFSNDYIDRDLARTGISIVVISPGTGIFDVDYETLRATTESLVGTGIGIDLVCLPKIPLHSVPLFRYRNPQYDAYQDDFQSKMIGSEENTPRQRNIVGSFTTIRESLSPSKGSGCDHLHRVDSLHSKAAPDEWNFAIPHWLDVSFWTGASQELLSRPGAKLPKEQRQREIINHFKYFAVRCKMYELEMTSGPEAGSVEISIAPLSNDLSLPQEDNEEETRELDGIQVLTHSKKHSSLAESGLSHLKAIAKPTEAEKAIFGSLTRYDDEKAVLSASALLSPSKTSPKKMVKILDEKTVKKALAADPHVFGTSFSEADHAPKGLSLAGAAMSLRNKTIVQAAPERQSRRKDGTGSALGNAVSSSTLLTARPPRLSRQISLGNRGFGIAAPKAAVAELQIEHANAGKGFNAPALITSTSAMASHLLASPRSDKSQDRPSSSSQGSLRSISNILPNAEKAEAAIEKSRPIAIKSTVQPDRVPQKSRSILGSVYERAEPTNDLNDLSTVQKLKSSDSLKASKSKLFANVELPTTLSPTTAMSPWLNVLNPSNPTIDDNVASQYKRWQHVFPRPLKLKSMKWKSLCSPASVPLTTEFFPTKLQLEKEYEQKPYSISLNVDEDLSEAPRTREEFLRELIGARLSKGFQIVVGPAVAEAFGQRVMKIANAFSPEKIAEDGSSVFMASGNVIHQLSCVNNTEVEIYTFTRKVGAHDPKVDFTAPKYKLAMRTVLDEGYHSKQAALQRHEDDYNWNFLDSYIAGHDDELTESLRFWRARFVLIPVQRSPMNERREGGDTDEETRLEGIKALSQMWQRNRYVPPSDRQFHNLGSRKRKDPNPLDIVYQTADPSVVIKTELETLPLLDVVDSHVRRSQLLSESGTFRKTNLNIGALVEAIQAPPERGGIRMQNRRWHWRLHYNCFIGSDMTTWLLERFEDVETREEAVELGNLLMVKDDEKNKKDKESAKEPGKDKDRDNGIFVHVDKRHDFRDGQYFYQVAKDHVKQRPDTRSGWTFASRRRDSSIPATPMTEAGARESPRIDRALSSSTQDDRVSESGNATPISSSIPKRQKVYLSKVMKYDVDPRKRSYRPERINLHYDRLHNPDSCYHIRIDWLNTTSKLIEDAIQSWAVTAERYGLRLIEVPVAEAVSITEVHPFRVPFRIKLALHPPDKQPPGYFDATSFVPQATTVRHPYQKAILKKHDFVLDIEAAQNFPSNVDVMYSWGRPNFRYTQYIHRTGVLLAQISDEGDILLLSNKLYNNRAISSRDLERFNKVDHSDRHAERNGRLASASSYSLPTPFASPMLRATAVTSPMVGPSADVLATGFALPKTPTILTPEAITQDLDRLCSSASRLEAFYKEVLSAPLAAATPRLKSSLHSHSSLDTNMDVPTLGLPPGLLARELSPSPMSLNAPSPGRRSSAHPSDASGSTHASPRPGFSPA